MRKFIRENKDDAVLLLGAIAVVWGVPAGYAAAFVLLALLGF